MKVVLINPYEIGRQPFGLAQPAAWPLVPGTWPLDEPTRLECVRILFVVDTAYKVTSIDLQANAIE